LDGPQNGESKSNHIAENLWVALNYCLSCSSVAAYMILKSPRGLLFHTLVSAFMKGGANKL
jgi:hypothetical protein